MTRRRITGVILILASITTGILALTLSASGATAMNRATTTCAKDGYDASAFRRQLDPIVAYGQVSAHLHDFFGRVDISSTMGAPIPYTAGHLDDPGYTPVAFSNCKMYGDWAAYWFPTPKFNGSYIKPGVLRNTWQAPAGVQVAVPPFGETFVAGNPNATTTDPHVAWTCGDIDVTYPAPKDCTSVPSGVVTAQVTFPDCWDGKTGYTYPPGGAAGQSYDTPVGLAPSHFSYSVNGACPAGSVPCTPGKLMAQLITQQTFIDPRTNTPMVNPNNADGTLGLSFSSGSYLTYHADYENTWNHMLRDVVSYCLNTGGPAGHGCPAGTYINFFTPAHQLD